MVGAGPAGLETARGLAERGCEVLVVDERDPAERSKLCAGLISCRGARELGLDLAGSLRNSVRGARFYAPGGLALTVQRPEPVAHVVDRGAFDLALLERARRAGVAVRLHTRMLDVRSGEVVVRTGAGEERLAARMVVGADGARSRTRRALGIRDEEVRLLMSAQADCTGRFDADFVEVHLGDFASGFFGWLIPLGPTEAKIGLGVMGGRPGRAGPAELRAFIARRFPTAVIGRIRSAPIPLGAPLAGIARDGLALVGDAAFQVKATSGGGIIFGMRSARILADSIAEHVRRGRPLAYERRIAALSRELRAHWRLRRLFNLLSADQTDRLLEALKGHGIEQFLEEEGDMDSPSSFLPKLLLRPGLWLPAGGSLVTRRAAMDR